MLNASFSLQCCFINEYKLTLHNVTLLTSYQSLIVKLFLTSFMINRERLHACVHSNTPKRFV